MKNARMLDIPCGDGELIGTLHSFFPEADVRGCDLSKPNALAGKDFAVIDANRPFTVFPGIQFDHVFSVSGVMEFDNTLQFFEQCRSHLRNDGEFIVTNDNVVTMYDRITYLLLGKPRQYQLFVTQDQPTWKIIPIHNMVRLLQDAGFRIRGIRYVSLKAKDLIFLPLAVLIFPLQWLYTQYNRSKMPVAERHALYPFKSLLYRHYLIVCDKDGSSNGPSSRK
jgi:cyclopropane fatty-acyl-phospholipid synthase-like methyltransferase